MVDSANEPGGEPGTPSGPGDWFRLYRRIVQSQVFQNEGLFKVWVWCLASANWRDTWVSVETGRGSTEVLLHPGQFIYGRKSAASLLKMKQTTVRYRMAKLEDMRNIDIQPSTHYSIVTVCNWETYQYDFTEVSQATCQPTANQLPTNCQPTANQLPQSKNTKKIKNSKKEKNNTSSNLPHPIAFDAWWESYPRKVAKFAARTAYDRAVTTLLGDGMPKPVAQQFLLEQCQLFAASHKGQGQFCPHPATWLNGGRYHDDPKTWEDKHERSSNGRADAYTYDPQRKLGDF